VVGQGFGIGEGWGIERRVLLKGGRYELDSRNMKREIKLHL
jgi:hypothetical protein